MEYLFLIVLGFVFFIAILVAILRWVFMVDKIYNILVTNTKNQENIVEEIKNLRKEEV